MALRGNIEEIYEQGMTLDGSKAYYGNSGFYNYGYWRAAVSDQASASRALVDQLLADMPANCRRILDVACGLGASTERLVSRFPDAAITGINIAEPQLEECRKRCPQAEFLKMDAAQLKFGDSEFDALLCVEAAFHFVTRERFLGEALRVLKPGGRLLLTDILWDREFTEKSRLLTLANHLEEPEEYSALLKRLGFADIRVTNATHDCAIRHFGSVFRFLLRQVETGALKPVVYSSAVRSFAHILGGTRYYLLISATKQSA